MLETLICRSALERKEVYCDHHALCLHAAFFGSMQTLDEIAKRVYEDFILALTERCLFDGETEYRKNVKASRLMEIFDAELRRYGRGGFYGDSFLITKGMTNKKELRRVEEGWLGNGIGENYFSERDRMCQKRLEQAKEFGATFSEAERDKRVIEKLLQCEAYPPGVPPLAAVRCFYKCAAATYQQELYFAELNVKISKYCLGSNIEDTAFYLANWLEQMGTAYEGTTGYVCEGDFFGLYGSPLALFFDAYPEGVVKLEDGRTFSSKEWLHMHFIESIEWVNLLSKEVAGKITDWESLAAYDDVEYKLLPNGNVLLNMKKPFKDFRQSDWKNYFPYLKACFRPGYSWIDIDSLPFINEFNLCIDPSSYTVCGDEAFFQRGDFDFITSTF